MKKMIVKAGVGVLIVKNKKLLTGIRKGSHGAGKRAFPGGHIDPEDSTVAESAEREAKEETGIKCRVRILPHGDVDLLTTFDILSEDGAKRYMTMYVVADYVSGGTEMDNGSIRPLEPDKCVRWEWNTLDELKLLSRDQIWIPIDRILYHRKGIGL